MQKYILLFFGLLLFYSCLNSNDAASDYKYEYIAIDKVKTPESFSFGKTDTITLNYSLPNSCYSFDEIYYEVEGNKRIVAVTAYVVLNEVCTQTITKEEMKFAVNVNQQEDYIFKFFKGKDKDGENIFEEVTIPVE